MVKKVCLIKIRTKINSYKSITFPVRVEDENNNLNELTNITVI